MAQTTIPSFKINIVANIVAKMIGVLIPLVVSPYIYRILTPEGVGGFTYATSVVTFFSLVAIFGFTQYGTKAISKVRDDKQQSSNVFWTIFLTRFLVFLVVSAGYFAVLLGADLTKGFTNSIYYSLFLILVGNFLDCSFFYQGKENNVLLSLISLVVNILYLACVFLFVKTPNDLLLYSIIKSSATLGVSLISFAFLFGKLSRPKGITAKMVAACFVESLRFFIPVLITTITPVVDKTMIGIISGTTEVGYYEAADRIKSVIVMLSSSVSTVALSRIAYLFQNNNNNEASEKILKCLELICFIGFPAVLGLYAVSPYLFPAYFGNEYQESANVMNYLAPSILISSLDTVYLTGYFYAKGEIKKATLFMLACDLLNVVSNVAFIYFMGAKGAALTSTISNFLLLLMCFLSTKKELNYKAEAKPIIQIVVAAFVMFGIALAATFLLGSIASMTHATVSLITIVGGALIYFGLSCVMRQRMMMVALKSFTRLVKRKK